MCALVSDCHELIARALHISAGSRECIAQGRAAIDRSRAVLDRRGQPLAPRASTNRSRVIYSEGALAEAERLIIQTELRISRLRMRLQTLGADERGDTENTISVVEDALTEFGAFADVLREVAQPTDLDW